MCVADVTVYDIVIDFTAATVETGDGAAIADCT
jgi:hypothetical protein